MEPLVVVLVVLVAVALIYALVSFGVLGSVGAKARSRSEDDRRDQPPGRTQL